MVKGTRANGESVSEPTIEGVDIREMMQKLITEIGVLNGVVAGLKRLDQTVTELKEQLEAHRGETTPMEDGIGTSRERHQNYQQGISRYSKLEFPKFSEGDVRSWLFRVEQFFNMENIPIEEKISIAALHLEGEALQWHLSFMKYRQYIQPPTWNEYVVALVEKFGADSRKKLVSFEFSNLSHVYPQETSIKKTSYACKVLDEMPKRDPNVDSLYSGTVDRNNETETFEELFLDVFYIDTESDVDGFEDWYLDATSVEAKSNIGDVEGLILDVLINENGNEVFTTSLNSEEANSNEDELVRTRNKNNIEAGTAGLFMHSQFSPSRVLEDPKVDFDLSILDVYSKLGREVTAAYMFNQLPEGNGMSKNNMISDFVPLASWYPILVGYFNVSSCDGYLLEYENVILDNEKEKQNGVGAKQWELDKFVVNKGQQQFFELKYDRIRFPGVKNAFNSRTCDVYSRAAWKEVLSWQAHSDTILSKIMTSCDLWLNLESNKMTCPCEVIEKSLFLITEERPKLSAEERVEVWIDGILSLATWDVTGNKKAIMLRIRIYDHMMYLVNCHIAAHLEVINYQISSSYFTHENKDDLKGKGCTHFLPLQFSMPSLGKMSSTSFGQNMENGGNQLFMLFHSLGPIIRNTSPTVEGTASSVHNGRTFAVINSLGQAHEYCEYGFKLGGAGGKMPERIKAKDLLNIVESIADGLSKQKSLSKQRKKNNKKKNQQIMLLGNS